MSDDPEVQPHETPAAQDVDLTTSQPVSLGAWCVLAVMCALVLVALLVPGACPVVP